MFDGMDHDPRQGERARAGAYYLRRKAARRAAGLDEAWNSRAMARKLVDDAAARVELRPDLSGRSNIIRMMLAMYELDGSLCWRRGWTDHLRDLFTERDLPVPSGKVLRWYRSKLADCPMMFAHCPMVDAAALERVEARYLRV
jgi:hypothetical protein